jgi:transposase
MNALAGAHDAAMQMIDTTIVCVQLIGKIHAAVDTNGLPVRLALTAGKAHDNQRAGRLPSRLKPGSMLLTARGYDADRIRASLPKKGV